MFFRKKFNGIAEVLDARYRASSYTGQNPADKGELCEVILRDAVDPLVAGQFATFRGGKVVDVTRAESAQCDIVITSRAVLPAFEDKGLYPIETVYAVVHVTSTLDSAKLQSSIDAAKSIPKDNPRFAYTLDWDQVKSHHKAVFRDRLPYQVVFAFAGDIGPNDIETLESQAASDPSTKTTLPDLIVVNKKVMVEKVVSENAQAVGGDPIGTNFARADLKDNPGIFLLVMASELSKLASWTYIALPDYIPYFNADLDECAQGGP